MFRFSKDDKAVINVSTENRRFKRGRTVVNPVLFVVAKEDISEGRTEGGAHGHTVRLLIEVTIKKKMVYSVSMCKAFVKSVVVLLVFGFVLCVLSV